MGLAEDFRDNKYMSLVPDYLKWDQDFLVYFSFLVHEFNITNTNIRKFTDLIDPDKVPMGFIEALGAYMNYTYLPNASDDFNREVLMRMRTIWEQRGTEHSIIMAGTHGANDGWVGGEIFIPGYDISKNMAELEIPRNAIFRHNISKFSGLHRFPSEEFYAPGILLLRTPYFDEQVRRRVYENTPAGLKYIFEIMLDFFPDINQNPDDYGQYNELSFHKWFRIWPKDDIERLTDDTDIDFWYTINMTMVDDDSGKLIHSKNRKKHSGNWGASVHSILFNTELDLLLGTSMLPLPQLKVPFAIKDYVEILVPNKETIIHDEVTRGSKKFQSNELFTTRSIADDSQYIISGSGEYLDKISKDTAEHIMGRSLDYKWAEFSIYDEDPSLGDIDLDYEGERPIWPDDATYFYPYVGDLRPCDLRDNFYQMDVIIDDEVYHSRAEDILNAEFPFPIVDVDNPIYEDDETESLVPSELVALHDSFTRSSKQYQDLSLMLPV